MLKINGILLNIIDKSKYKNKEGLEIDTKAKVQVLVENKRANGSIVKELHTISIPDGKIPLYKDKVNKEVEIPVGIISEKHSFYGV
ncbi:hypothetical protein [Arcobacter roscoffensis]|uniref:Uncharacterized protein n=1 Tax=Arcobacter roscoffensis TaxID=2961520 RepID=A0ABY5EAY0_9BACT|nr:hypothetical protein [Arcobacter roscoffensis]UTJ07880.1 hypothetical protein NJU99_07220 [Arcobacter roscoffensis]